MESDTVVEEDEIVSYYEENKESVFKQPGGITGCKHIIITPEDGNNQKALADITAVREKIIAGMDFAEAAKEFSTGPSGPTGGNLGAFQRGQMVKEFEDVAFNIPINEVSQPVLTQFGYHLILVEGREDAKTASIEEVRDYITTNLKREKFFTNIQDSVKVTKPEWAKEEV